MRLTIRELREMLSEGGLKLPPEHRRDLTPVIVREAAAVYREVMEGWNRWLQSRNMPPVEPLRPTGSSVHADVDFEEGVDAVYGDIDYLVSFPVTEEGDTKRKAEAASARLYTELLVEYLSTVRPEGVDVELTLRSSPLLLIIRMPDGGLVQVDTIITHPDYSEWMKGRYSPERGIKGYVTGGLYKALGDYLMIQISTEGVLAREKDGERVPSRMRKGVTVRSISTDFRNFLVDIARDLAGDGVELDPLLEENPGGDPDAVNIGQLALGIRGLALTLQGAGMLDAGEMLSTVLRSFQDGLQKSLDRKVAMGLRDAKRRKLEDLNSSQFQRVRDAFGL